VSDPSSGVTLELTGTGFASENFFGYTILSAGTVTGFTFSLKGVTFAIGTGYSVPASTIDTAIEDSVFAGNASPILALWFSVPVALAGTAAEISKNLAFLAQYTDITAVDIKGTDLLTVNVAEFKKDQTLLNVVTEGFAVSDTEANVAAGLAKLLADVSHIKSIELTDGATPALKLTTGQATKYDSVIALLTGDYILETVAGGGAVTTTGHGNDLQIADIAGKDTITGGLERANHFRRQFRRGDSDGFLEVSNKRQPRHSHSRELRVRGWRRDVARRRQGRRRQHQDHRRNRPADHRQDEHHRADGRGKRRVFQVRLRGAGRAPRKAPLQL
jgi:hypothetical protein